MQSKDHVVIGLVGSTLDSGVHPRRWEKWRPSVALCQQEHLLVTRFELLCQPQFLSLAHTLRDDMATVSPETTVRITPIVFADAWDFEQVYGALHDFVRAYTFVPDQAEYLVHITTGSHVAQICLFLLTESHHIPGKLIQTSPPGRHEHGGPGQFSIIDLDLSKYDRLASRFRQEQHEGESFLKSGIATRNAAFNRLIARIEQVAINSRDPLLLLGPTGAGKSHLAKRMYQLKQARHQVRGAFVEVNCATMRGDAAMSALFGHIKGAFTGAVRERPGLLRAADGGVLFLDEIGELGLDEQAMLLRALEDKTFLPLGGDREVHSEFQLIAGTNADLRHRINTGQFRADLFARINLWTFHLPGLRERREDIAPNLQYELEQYTQRTGTQVTFSREARDRFLDFAMSPEALWSGNFRDLNSAVTRMTTLTSGGRITLDVVDEEIARLRAAWHLPEAAPDDDWGAQLCGPERWAALDLFDRLQLRSVLTVCRQTRTLSEAGRTLFHTSRQHKKTVNDADRLRKYLARFALTWEQIQQHNASG